MCSMHEVDRGVYYDRYVYYDMGMLAWHAAVQRYPRLAIGRLGGSRARRILDGLPTEMVASPCCRGRGYGRCNIIMGQEDDMTGVTLQRAYGHSIPVLSAAMAGVLVAGANVSRRACVLERAHRQEAVDGVQLCCLLAGALQAGESAGILVLSGILVWAT